VADPSDATYVPRPEWYFLWLFQLLKYFPGKLEMLGAHGIPLLLVGLLLLLPFLDRRPERRLWKRPIAALGALFVLGFITALTSLGLRDVPPPQDPRTIWNAEALGGRLLAEDQGCVRCHREGGAAAPWARVRITRDEGWIGAHVADPDVVGPGVREPPSPPSAQEQHAAIAFVKAVRSGVPQPPPLPHDDVMALLGRHCLGCHVIDGQGRGGRSKAPNLARAGREHDAAWLAGWIADPAAYEYDTDMPAFGNKLSREQIDALARYLATRK
jgi:mono/diheme cytochrome c family protein